ncbi:MAG: ImmA/IrrE family metallo-endopeptidase [Bacteroidales bacterium]|nr:ImmA/IrrE family metallo-endopeptidase [Bacteroidales bacterium]
MKIKSKPITWKYIRDKADKIRDKYIHQSLELPVNIERIITDYGIDLDFIDNLKKDLDVEGYISKNLKTIFLDKDSYMSEKYYSRLRFTMAHEFGHAILHENLFKKDVFHSKNEWIKIVQSVSNEDLDWIERQASEFAGRILVPHLRLIEFIEDFTMRIDAIYKDEGDDDSAMEIAIMEFCRKYSSKFQVSNDVLEIRIRKENFEKHFRKD